MIIVRPPCQGKHGCCRSNVYPKEAVFVTINSTQLPHHNTLRNAERRLHPIDLDEFGNVVGSYSDSVNDRNGFYYDRGENTYVLYDPGVEVFGLNNLGEMVGTDWNTGEGLYWRSPSDPNPVTLSPLTGHQTTLGGKINDAGIIVGRSHGNGFLVGGCLEGECGRSGVRSD